MVLNQGAKLVITLDYSKIVTNHPKVWASDRPVSRSDLINSLTGQGLSADRVQPGLPEQDPGED